METFVAFIWNCSGLICRAHLLQTSLQKASEPPVISDLPSSAELVGNYIQERSHSTLLICRDNEGGMDRDLISRPLVLPALKPEYTNLQHAQTLTQHKPTFNKVAGLTGFDRVSHSSKCVSRYSCRM